MTYKELGLIAACVISVIIIYKSMTLLEIMEKDTPMPKTLKRVLKFTAIAIPILGFLIIYLMQSSKKQSGN
ncbi:hypothetical protein [Solitalea koreensis]|uniref:Uncharacterized protein n=1 Tax=Solitalea koreensis TaxID=543615 RepID=A0A521C1S0_9SPHI|nr:hypothetical protein [Solitalea koreensis]SMO53402.1 hypothetical protein SAMN06265350_103133 [Solitalea koreensis]